MAIRQLTHFNDERFRKKSKPVTKFDEKLWELLGDMRDTLKRTKGYGCAAVHVGVLKRVVLVLDNDNAIELVNPVVIAQSTEAERILEGSIAPEAPRGYVERPKKVTVEACDRNGNPVTINAEGFFAATLCHEIDHLDGLLYSDKIVSYGQQGDRK